jgi:hypothetical protein
VVDVIANAVGFAAGAQAFARVAPQADRALPSFVRPKLSFACIALCAAVLAAFAFTPLHAAAVHEGFYAAARGARASAILRSLGAALLTFALALSLARVAVREPRAQRAWV